MVRFKNRWLLVDVAWRDGSVDTTMNAMTVLNAVRDSVVANFGDSGLGTCLTSLQVRYYSPYTNTCVIRVATAEVDKVVSSLAMMRDLRQRRVAMRLVRVAGNLVRCRKAAMAHSAEQLRRGRFSAQHRPQAEEMHQLLGRLEP